MGLIILLIILSVAVVVAAEKITVWLGRWCKVSGWDKFGATAVLMAGATTLPELAVTMTANLEGQGSLGLGIVLGSNMVNLSLIMGLAVVAAKTIRFEAVWKDKRVLPVWISFIPYLLILRGGHINRIEGAILLLLFGWYLKKTIGEKKSIIPHHPHSATRAGIHLIGWTAVLMAASRILVLLATEVASDFGVSPLFVGIFLVGLGTSLPELVFNLMAVGKGHKEMALGSLVGSCVFNSTWVLGLTALVKPIEIGQRMALAGPLVQYFFIVAVLLAFISSKKSLVRWEGAVLVVLYLYYVIIEGIVR